MTRSVEALLRSSQARQQVNFRRLLLFATPATSGCAARWERAMSCCPLAIFSTTCDCHTPRLRWYRSLIHLCESETSLSGAASWFLIKHPSIWFAMNLDIRVCVILPSHVENFYLHVCCQLDQRSKESLIVLAVWQTVLDPQGDAWHKRSARCCLLPLPEQLEYLF